MLAGDVHMVVQHKVLVVQHKLQIIAPEVHANAVHPLRSAVGRVAEIVDDSGDEHEKRNAQQNAAAKFEDKVTPALFSEQLFRAEDPEKQPDHGQTRAGIDAGPFARRAEAEKESAEKQIARLHAPAEARRVRVVPEKQIQEQVHQQDEEHGIGVYCGEPRLHIVHEIRCHDRCARKGDGRAAE